MDETYIQDELPLEPTEQPVDPSEPKPVNTGSNGGNSVTSIAPRATDENLKQKSVEETLTKPGFPPAHREVAEGTSIALLLLSERFNLQDESQVKILGSELESTVKEVYEKNKRLSRLYPESCTLHFPRMPFLIPTVENEDPLKTEYTVDLDKLNEFRAALRRERKANSEYFENIRMEYVPDNLVGLYACIKEALNSKSKIFVEEGLNIKLGDKMSDVNNLTNHLSEYLGLEKHERSIARGYIEQAYRNGFFTLRTIWNSRRMYSINNDLKIRDDTDIEEKRSKFLALVEKRRKDRADKVAATHKN